MKWKGGVIVGSAVGTLASIGRITGGGSEGGARSTAFEARKTARGGPRPG